MEEQIKDQGEFLLNLSKMLGLLASDVALCERRMEESPASWGRIFVRSTFAAVEALSFFLKQHAFTRQIIRVIDSFKPDRPDLHCRELSLLMDESYTLKDNGKPKTNKAKLRKVPNLLFALSAFGEAIGSQRDILKDAGYDALIKAVKIRNQLTHPKNPEALQLTDDQIAIVKSAFAWVRRELTQIIISAPGVKINEIELANNADAGDVL